MNDYVSADNAKQNIIIVGGGLTGASLALALAQAGFTITLLDEKQAANWDQADYGLRVSALSIASQQVLTKLGVWQGIADKRVSPYKKMRVWDVFGSAELEFNSQLLRQPYLGHIVENDLIQAELLQKINTTANINYLCPAKIETIQTNSDVIKVQLAQGKILTGALLVGADGANSYVRTAVGINCQQYHYQQQAIVAVVETAATHAETAWQRFLPQGPLALLPLADGRCSIVWSVPSDQADALMQQSDRAFCQAVTTASEQRLGKILSCGTRAVFPLQYQHAEKYIAPRVALVGDAAHVVHPLAGQGINLGLLDVAQLAHQLQLAQGSDLASLRTLQRYQRCRRSENQLMLWSLHAIQRLYTQQQPPLTALRGLALRCADRLPGIKLKLMQQAMGLQANLPPLAALPYLYGELAMPL